MLPERFGSRNRRPFITGQEISPRQLNRQKDSFEKPLSPGVTISEKSDLLQFTQNGAERLQMLPERFRSRNRMLLSQDKKSALDNLTGRKRFFGKKP
ncbi:Hypothetical predicted protein [Podarcis lilfordi]|uniref:Uncharacterized protein n=1 Tax=Podarcis lilfordi TaxID=74358 RepID=A0AA35K553_9SAUR|nr:Hypothetical predicted protein [Podarcis lilfordi]